MGQTTRKKLIEALGEEYRNLLLPGRKKRNFSVDWEICKVFKGDCGRCIFKQFKQKEDRFPCQTRPFPPTNPKNLSFKELVRRRLRTLKMRDIVMDHSLIELRDKDSYFNYLIKETYEETSPEFSKRH